MRRNDESSRDAAKSAPWWDTDDWIVHIEDSIRNGDFTMSSSFINQHGKPEYTHDYEWFEKGGPDGQLIRKGAVLCTEHIAQVKASPSFDHFYKVGHLCMVYCDYCQQK